MSDTTELERYKPPARFWRFGAVYGVVLLACAFFLLPYVYKLGFEHGKEIMEEELQKARDHKE